MKFYTFSEVSTARALALLLSDVVSSFSLRLQRLEHLAAKFNHKATNIESWLNGKDVMLERNDDIEGANLAEIMVSVLRESV